MAKRRMLLVLLAFWLSGAGIAWAQEDEFVRQTETVEFGFDFLWCGIKKDFFPALATIGNVNDAVPGALGQPGTRIILGNQNFDHNEIDGGRVSFNYWLTEAHGLGIEGNFFMLSQETMSVNITNDGSSPTDVLAKPFFNPVTLTEDADPRGFPGVLAGNVNFNYTSRLMGAEVNGRWFMYGNDVDDGLSISVLGGVRWLNLQESFTSAETVVELPVGTGSTFFISDQFGTFNQYVAGQTGLQLKYRWGHNLAINVQGKFAAGPNFETLKINGFSSVLDQFGTLTTGNQGLYAQPSNIGQHHHTVIAYMPEGSGGFCWEPFCWLRLQVGYTFMYLNKTIRPGQSIDRNVNIQPVGATDQFGPAQPVASFNQTSFWVNFINVGVTFSF